jgi:hypothetical protein
MAVETKRTLARLRIQSTYPSNNSTIMYKQLVSNILGLFSVALLGLALLQVPQLYAQAQDNPPNFPAGSSASLNWSGYVAEEPGAYTSVTGSWVVPTVAGGSVGRADATWVGIGGVRSSDLIQAGTQAIVGHSGRIVYNAWYELLPDVSIPVNLDVSPGDSITTTITKQSDDTWSIVIHNNTTGKQFTKTVSYRSSLSSAEWVEERVSDIGGSFYPLDDFGSVSFSDAFATKDGQTLALSQIGAHPLSMVSGSGSVLASASSLSGNGFTVTKNSSSPAPVQQAQPTIYTIAPSEPQVVSLDPGVTYVITIGQGGITVSRDGTTQTRNVTQPKQTTRPHSKHHGFQFSLPL